MRGFDTLTARGLILRPGSGLVRWGVLCLCALVGVACGPAINPLQTRVAVQWQTASEVNTAGFNVYRSENRDGPYTKLNARLIAPSANPLLGGAYRYEDETATSGQTYYYQLEDVELNGNAARHDPIVIAVPQPLGGYGPLVVALLVLALAGVAVYWLRARIRHAPRARR